MKNTLLLVVVLYSSFIYSQNKTTENKEPIIYAEFIAGYTGKLANTKGFILGGELNYQRKHHLFSFRYTDISDVKLKNILFFPVPLTKSQNSEIALLYGYRYTEKNFSLSVSGGLSYNTLRKNEIIDYNTSQLSKQKYFGFPLEANFRLFKPKKKRYRIYYIIPVGRPTSFGNSIGIKLLGNISKNSFVGIGITFGIGIHKKY